MKSLPKRLAGRQAESLLAVPNGLPGGEGDFATVERDALMTPCPPPHFPPPSLNLPHPPFSLHRHFAPAVLMEKLQRRKPGVEGRGEWGRRRRRGGGRERQRQRDREREEGGGEREGWRERGGRGRRETKGGGGGEMGGKIKRGGGDGEDE